MSQNTKQQKFFTVGDRSRAISETLEDCNLPPAVIPLGGSTVTFRMVKNDGTVIIAGASATIDNVAGLVSYAWQSAEMALLSDGDICFYWWIVTTSGKTEHFPGDGKQCQINWVGVP